MPTAQEYLRSDQPTVVVFSVVTDNTIKLNANYHDWVGGKSGLAYDLGVDTIDNDSQLYLSTGQVNGLASNIVVMGELWVERSINDGGVNIDYGKIDIACEADQLNLFQRDWYNQPFTMYIGYEGGNWADFAVLYTGKTLDNTIIGERIQVDLSLNPVGLEKEFPVNKFDDGRTKPYLIGNGYKFKPVEVNPTVEDGLWMFHDGVVGTTDTEWGALPFVSVDFTSNVHYGAFKFTVFDSVALPDVTTATNELPADAATGTGSISVESDHIRMVLPDEFFGGAYPALDYCQFSFEATSETPLLEYDVEVDVALSSDSTVTSVKMRSSVHFGINITQNVQTFKWSNTATSSGIGNRIIEFVAFYKQVDEDAETAIIEIYGVRCKPKLEATDVRVLNPSDSSLFRLPTYRVDSVLDYPNAIPSFLAIYDDAGYLKIDPNNTGFVMDAVGDTTNDDLVAACQYISTAANDTNSPITSSITSPTIGKYISTSKRWIDQVREMVGSVDCYLDVDSNGNNIDIKRRWNGQPVDADGNITAVDAFSFDDDSIIDFKELAAEPSYSKSEVRYNIKENDVDNSATATSTNIFSRSNETLTTITPLVDEADAQVVANLVTRDGTPRRKYEITVQGAGHGIKPESVGFLSHQRTKDGLMVVRRVREYILSKKTIITGIKNG